MALDERKLEVLRAIVEDYVATQEPVGSKALVERHNLRVSPATVRNDMAVLEDEGYIRQPHTSAGRVPTDAGYRLFVDKLSRVKPLSQAERRAIERFLIGAVDLDDVVHRTVRLLAQLTRQVAVVHYPSLSRASEAAPSLRPPMTALSTVLLETLVERTEERIALAGTANLARGGLLDFSGSIRPILEALEEEVILLKLFGEVEPSITRVRIGDENEIEDLRTASIVATGYGPGSMVVGGMGVLGPTRMDYPGNIATVRAVARYVGDLLAQS
jgi:heat-inducible transcriptional repressor